MHILHHDLTDPETIARAGKRIFPGLSRIEAHQSRLPMRFRRIDAGRLRLTCFVSRRMTVGFEESDDLVFGRLSDGGLHHVTPRATLDVASPEQCSLYARTSIRVTTTERWSARFFNVDRRGLVELRRIVQGDAGPIDLEGLHGLDGAADPVFRRLNGLLAMSGMWDSLSLEELAASQDFASFEDVVLLTVLEVVDRLSLGVATHAPRPAAPRAVRRAEEYMLARLDEPVSMTAMAEDLGVGLRALQLAFRRHHGRTPSQFLRDRRLDMAHRLLIGDAGFGSITQVAFACGFENLSRFAAHYRHRFGHAPSAARP